MSDSGKPVNPQAVDGSQLSVIEISKKARQKFRARRYEEAQNLFRLGLEREPDNPYLLSGLGDCCRETGEFEEAENCYRHLLEGDRNNLFALRGLGDVCKKQNRHQEAIRYWNQYLSLRPQDKHVMTRIADSYKALVQYVKAEEVYEQILKIAPRDRFALTGMADLQHRLGKDEEAIRCYERILEYDADELHILTIIGKLCWRINDFTKAEIYFRRALKIDPQNPYALYGLGNCFRWHHQYAKALEIWQEILQFSEGTQALHTRMGDAYIHIGDNPKAETSYLRALDLGHDPYSTLGLIRLYSERTEWPAAGRYFWRLMEDQDSAIGHLHELNKRFVRSGQREVMLTLFTQLIDSGLGEQFVLDEIHNLQAKLSGQD